MFECELCDYVGESKAHKCEGVCPKCGEPYCVCPEGQGTDPRDPDADWDDHDKE